MSAALDTLETVEIPGDLDSADDLEIIGDIPDLPDLPDAPGTVGTLGPVRNRQAIGPYHVRFFDAEGNCANLMGGEEYFDYDPLARNSFILRVVDRLFRREKKEFLDKTRQRSLEMNAEHKRPIPWHYPQEVARVTVDGPRGYQATYKIREFKWHYVTISMPEGVGNGEFGDFSDYEMQPFKAAYAYPPVEWADSWNHAGHVYIRLLEPSPFPDGSDKSGLFVLALGRAHFPYSSIMATGHIHEYARAACVSRTRPQEFNPGKSPKSAKKRRR